MRFVHIFLVAAALSAAPGSFAMAQSDDAARHGGGGHGGGGNHGAPLPVAGAGLPILAGVGLYYLIRKRLRG
ncbi:hypothetical protein ABLE91_08270 [Aquabacter sp. CN5-332]|uniref:hypothetical protein n=1 Tax=Aquabacter sp. CN5-332 TaxID=3156608 RepID=UPI0032B5B070